MHQGIRSWAPTLDWPVDNSTYVICICGLQPNINLGSDSWGPNSNLSRCKAQGVGFRVWCGNSGRFEFESALRP